MIAEAQVAAARAQVVALREAQTDAERILAETRRMARAVLEETQAEAAWILAKTREFIEAEVGAATAQGASATEPLRAPDEPTPTESTELKGGAAIVDARRRMTLPAAVPVTRRAVPTSEDVEVTRKAAFLAELDSVLFGTAVERDGTADHLRPAPPTESPAPGSASLRRVTSGDHSLDSAETDDDFWQRARGRAPAPARRRRHRHRLLFGAFGVATLVGLSTAGIALGGRI